MNFPRHSSYLWFARTSNALYCPACLTGKSTAKLPSLGDARDEPIGNSPVLITHIGKYFPFQLQASIPTSIRLATLRLGLAHDLVPVPPLTQV